jgi:hypothetical protein
VTRSMSALFQLSRFGNEDKDQSNANVPGGS